MEKACCCVVDLLYEYPFLFLALSCNGSSATLNNIDLTHAGSTVVLQESEESLTSALKWSRAEVARYATVKAASTTLGISKRANCEDVGVYLPLLI